MRLLRQKYWHELFEAGVFLKALNSAWEMFGGVFLLTFARGALPHIVVFFSQSELLGDHDRDDLVFRFVDTQLMHLSLVNTRTFVGVYLLFHGLMNAFLAYNLYRNRLWAYPLSISFVSLFFVYQIYRLAHTHSGILLAVSIFDLCFIALTWHEYQFQKNKHAAASAH
jgi:uncharacterized membrane protein